MSTKKFQWKCHRTFGVDAETAGAELDRIHAAHGRLSPADVVDESRPDEAPLHPVFEWDDFKAAENHRRWQARNMIRSITVVDCGGDNARPQQVYVHVPDSSPDDAGGYHPVSVVVARPDMFALAVAQLSRKLNEARAALDGLKEAARSAPDTDQERLARIALAAQAMEAASAAVAALH